MPPGLRRAGKKLPGRLRDPTRRSDPWQVLHNVGGGDFRAIGDDLLGVLVAHARLRPDDRVLDIGCGAGRIARPLAAHLSPTGGRCHDRSRLPSGYHGWRDLWLPVKP
jgi:SAM-dependent methyltransferase